MTTIIDRMAVELAVERGAYRSGLDAAAREFDSTASRIEASGKRMSGSLGRIVESGIGFAFGNIAMKLATLPGLMLKAAADFESTMGSISAASGATRAEIDALADSARELGKKYGVGASEAASATLELVKAGVSTRDAIAGASEAAIIMARATGGTAADGATIAAKAMQSFGLQASDMSMIVQQAAGVINSTTFELQDYALALGQGGKVAASSGLSFKDFNAAIAAIAPAFSSGSDAGTSFKTFLNALTPKTREAADLMKRYGLSFYDAAGQMKPIEEIAGQLSTALGGLSDAQKSATVEIMFGTDAMRAALALMDAGKDGVIALRDVTIANANAQKMAEERTKGLNGQLEKLGAAFQDLAIAVGNTGLLGGLADIAGAFAEIINQTAKTIDEIGKFIGLVGSRGYQDAVAEAMRDKSGDRIKGSSFDALSKRRLELGRLIDDRKTLLAGPNSNPQSLKTDLARFQREADQIDAELTTRWAREMTAANAAAQVRARSSGGGGGGVSTGSTGATGATGAAGYDDPFKTYALFAQDEAPKKLNFMEKEAKDLSTAVTEIVNRTDEMKRGFDQAAESFADGFADALIGAKSFGQAVRGLVADIAKLVIKKSIANPVADWLSAGLSSVFGGFFANGGDPPVGKVSVVGERGPELFVPKGAGTIIPNHALGGGTVVNYAPVIDARGADRAAIAELRQALRMDQATRVAQVTAIVREGIGRRRFRMA